MIDIETMQYVYATVVEATGQEELLIHLTPDNFHVLDELVVSWYAEQGYNVETIEDVWIRENQHQRAKLQKMMQLNSFVREPNGMVMKQPKYRYDDAVAILYEQIQNDNEYAEELEKIAHVSITEIREQQIIQYYEAVGFDLTYYLMQIDQIQYPKNY